MFYKFLCAVSVPFSFIDFFNQTTINMIISKIRQINVIIAHIVILQQQTGYVLTRQHPPGPPQQHVPQTVE